MEVMKKVIKLFTFLISIILIVLTIITIPIVRELFGNFQQNFNSIITPQYVHKWSVYAAYLSSLITLFLCTPFYLYAPSFAIKKCNALYPEETVLYVIKSGFWSRSIVTALCGAFVGLYILPVVFFENVLPRNTLNQYELLLYVLLFVMAISFFIIRYSMIYLITDKGIRFVTSYDCQNLILKKSICINFEDIESCVYNNILNFQQLKIKLKNKTEFRGIVFFVGLKQANLIINKHIEKE